MECSRNTREAGSNHLYGISVVPMVCVVVSSIKRVCTWLIIEYWLWVRSFFTSSRLMCEELMLTATRRSIEVCNISDPIYVRSMSPSAYWNHLNVLSDQFWPLVTSVSFVCGTNSLVLFQECFVWPKAGTGFSFWMQCLACHTAGQTR